MDFSATFWATMAGALAGAIVGALTAWLFALDLRRREIKHARDAALNGAVAQVVGLLGEYSAAMQSFMFGIASQSGKVSVVPPNADRAKLLASIRVAEMTASGDEAKPLKAVFALATRQVDETAIQKTVVLENAASALVQWRRGEITVDEAVRRVVSPPRLPAPSTDE